MQKAATSMLFSVVTGMLVLALLYAVAQYADIGHLFDVGSTGQYEAQIMKTVIDPKRISETLDDIGGLQAIKQDITTSILTPLQYPSVFFDRRAVPPCRGVLLAGSPGVGKTMLARAIAKTANVPFLSISLCNLENKYYGESSRLIAAVFSVARNLQPCVVFFDEIDGIMRNRTTEEQAASYGLKTELLTHMDGMSSTASDSFFVIGSTNAPHLLDPAMRRRLPKTIHVPMPSRDDREQILRAHKVAPALCASVAALTSDSSGSDLHELVKIASSIRFEEQLSDPAFARCLKSAKRYDDVASHVRPQTLDDFTRALRRLKGEGWDATIPDRPAASPVPDEPTDSPSPASPREPPVRDEEAAVADLVESVANADSDDECPPP